MSDRVKPVQTYATDRIEVRFDPQLCIHAARCVKGLPEVFDSKARPWIRPEAASPDAIAAVIQRCPSGALTWHRKDGGAQEKPDAHAGAVTMTDGPLEVRGDLTIQGEPAARAVLCRCGASANKPWCDNTHQKIGWKAEGDPHPVDAPQAEGGALPAGPLAIVPTLDGPLHAEGPLTIRAAGGREIGAATDTWLCRCGHSANKPYCDGSHARVGFKAPGFD